MDILHLLTQFLENWWYYFSSIFYHLFWMVGMTLYYMFWTGVMVVYHLFWAAVALFVTGLHSLGAYAAFIVIRRIVIAVKVVLRPSNLRAIWGKIVMSWQRSREPKVSLHGRYYKDIGSED